jgi:hypothetical protein
MAYNTYNKNNDNSYIHMAYNTYNKNNDNSYIHMAYKTYNKNNDNSELLFKRQKRCHAVAPGRELLHTYVAQFLFYFNGFTS